MAAAVLRHFAPEHHGADGKYHQRREEPQADVRDLADEACHHDPTPATAATRLTGVGAYAVIAISGAGAMASSSAAQVAETGSVSLSNAEIMINWAEPASISAASSQGPFGARRAGITDAAAGDRTVGTAVLVEPGAGTAADSSAGSCAGALLAVIGASWRMSPSVTGLADQASRRTYVRI
jgi:hypothetical protein